MHDVSFDFTDRNFIVTGASSGIGRAVTLALLEAGATVMGIARHMVQNEGAFAAYGSRFLASDIDVTDTDMMEQVVQAFVGLRGPLHGSVHAAGMANLMPLKVWNKDKAHELMEVNLWAGMALLKVVSKKKFSAKSASHVYISSVSAHRGQKGLSIYSASKGALEAMVRCTAQELAVKQQRVNSVCLGWVRTPMTMRTGVDAAMPLVPLGNGEPEDAAGLILFLLSDSARWVTGANLVMDGGYLA